MGTNEAVFIKDTTNNTMRVVRGFNAPLQNVWNAWTKSEILDQWWAPKPWTARTVSMDFREGGRWFYYMEGPKGERHYSICDYKEIVPRHYYSGTDGFTDADGKLINEMPSTNWKVEFEESGERTVVTCILTFDKQENMENIIKMGFQEGFQMGLGNLDEYLAKN